MGDIVRQIPARQIHCVRAGIVEFDPIRVVIEIVLEARAVVRGELRDDDRVLALSRDAGQYSNSQTDVGEN